VPVLTPSQIYTLAIQEGGLSPQAAVLATAIALAESGGNSDAVGDVGLENATWGPSVGLWQIRSLKAQTGTGGPRDVTQLKDPRFNARAMRAISTGGTNWRPWSTYTSGSYKKQLSKIGSGDLVEGTLDAVPIVGGVLGNAVAGVKSAATGLTSAWGKDAMTIGLKILAAGTAVAFVVVGAVHTVSNKE
jgi:hypothetical protein